MGKVWKDNRNLSRSDSCQEKKTKMRRKENVLWWGQAGLGHWYCIQSVMNLVECGLGKPGDSGVSLGDHMLSSGSMSLHGPIIR